MNDDFVNTIFEKKEKSVLPETESALQPLAMLQFRLWQVLFSLFLYSFFTLRQTFTGFITLPKLPNGFSTLEFIFSPLLFPSGYILCA